MLLYYRRYKLIPMNQSMTQCVLFLWAVRHSAGRNFITDGPLIFVFLTLYTADQTVDIEAVFLNQGCRVAWTRYTDRLPLCYGHGILIVPIPVAASSKERVCRCSLAGIADSSPSGGMGICLLWVLYVVVEVSGSGWSLTQRSPTERDVCVSVCVSLVWSRATITWTCTPTVSGCTEVRAKTERKKKNINCN
jgi:hypothetical protein